MKKLVSIILALTLLLSACSFALAEDDKPFKGRTINLWGWGFEFDSLLDEDGNFRDIYNSNNFVLAAVEEWCALNECSYSIHNQTSHDELLAAITAQEGPDLFNGWGSFPSLMLNGSAKALSPEVAERFLEKFGHTYMDVMAYNGNYYGVALPWNAIAVYRYDRTQMEELGIKTPREYWEEGNWTFETFKQHRKDCVVDIDGDGKVDYGPGHVSEFYLTSDPVEFDENGKLVSKVNTERFRDYYQTMYETLTIDKTGYGGNWNAFFQVDDSGVYGMSNVFRWEGWYYPTGLYKLAENGHVIESAPIPMWKQGDTEQAVNMNGVGFCVLSGAKNEDMAISLLEFILECGLEQMDDMSGDALGYDFAGLQGTTEISKKYLDEVSTALAEDMAALDDAGLTEEDIEWTKSLMHWYNKEANYMFDLDLPGAYFSIREGHYDQLYQVPVATFIAEFAPVHEAMCETFNNVYVTK